ncbi:response regulator [uncultured Desulfosarcina sp.]|uniref:response regulator n=1 Tax=uncultured Desulfosarcina sp. TaxID=218289 RepID=UPI0029C84D41|nr:response regulator [uncultured Desulfosarcina sp.]
MNQKIRLLVVEDDPNVSTVLCARLESLGYEVAATAETGLEAISRFYRHHPDLVTMDILLKGEMNGIEAATRISERSDVPIIYMTCLSDRKVFERAIATNPYGYIIKPYEINELRSAIEIARVKHKAAVEQKALIAQLQKALDEVKTLSGLLPICASCKWIRDDDNQTWQPIEEYIANHSNADFTHGICPECARRLYPDFYKERRQPPP